MCNLPFFVAGDMERSIYFCHYLIAFLYLCGTTQSFFLIDISFIVLRRDGAGLLLDSTHNLQCNGTT